MSARQYEVSETNTTPRSLAGVRARVPMGRVAEYFGRCLDQVYAAAKTGAILLDGQNIFVYHPRPDGDLDVAFCVGTGGPFNPIGSVEYITTPAGTAATTTHWGEYGGLRGAHDALQAWCKANQKTPAGPSWEVYGHWSNNPAELRTDIYYLLKETQGGA